MENKKIEQLSLFSVIISIFAILISIFSLVSIQQEVLPSKFPEIPKNARMISENTYKISTYSKIFGNVNGFIYISKKQKKKAYKPIRRNNHLLCAQPIDPNIKWTTLESYIIDTTNGHNMTDSFVKSTYQAAINEWNQHLSPLKPLSSVTVGTVDGIDLVSPDGKNEVLFGSVEDPSVIAMTIIWSSGNQIVEVDQIYNHDDFLWGDATVNSNLMDFQNIATHEFGHSLGLDDISDPICSDVTMYAYSSTGETKKRSLTSTDIEGIQELYSNNQVQSNGNKNYFSIIMILLILFNYF